MKVHIEQIDGLNEDEVIIRCGRVDNRISSIQRFILNRTVKGQQLTFYKDNTEFYFPVEQVLFFETDSERVFAHTAKDDYLVKQRLYELDDHLPTDFVRVSKSAIVNVRHVYAITRNLTASSLIQFTNSHKHVYVSRHYYSVLKERLAERSHYEK